MKSCASPAELLLCALADSKAGVAEATAEHVRDCTACRGRVSELRALLERTAAPPADHLDDFSFAEVAGATNESEIDDPTLAHLAGCEECRIALTEIASLVRDPFVRAELDRDGALSIVDGGAREDRGQAVRRPRVYRARIAVAGLAAAAALLLMARFLPRQATGIEPSTAIRHATIDVARAPRPVSPLGTVDDVGTMTWTSVPHADRYRVTVFDARGKVVWETEVNDTSATPPGAVLERSAGELRWRVKARTSFDRWIDSDFAEFSLRGDK